jgi:hypothetical protein
LTLQLSNSLISFIILLLKRLNLPILLNFKLAL